MRWVHHRPWIAIFVVLSVANTVAADLEVTTLARTIAPGEPVRVVVSSRAPLEQVDATWGQATISFHPVDGTRQRFTGWLAVPLAQSPGRVVLRGVARYGAGVATKFEHPLVVLAKRFPSERLTVEPKFAEPPPELRARIAAEQARLHQLYTRRSRPARPFEPFARPLSGAPTSIFGKKRIFNGKPRTPHPGLDLRAAVGTPVVCSGAGTVVLAGDLYYSGDTVIVDHGGGLFTLYAHLSRIDVHENDTIERGARIGLSGATGRVTGPHLHWGAKIGDEPFDPVALTDDRLFPRR